MNLATLAALKRARRYLIPLLFFGYMLAILDRQTISLAALQMNASLRLSATQFAWGASAFFIGYLIFEIPSNLLLQRFGARIWIARIMLTWGLVTAATAFAIGPLSFAGLRFLLGVSEAGFLPGVIFYLSLWFPPSMRSRVTADFLVSIPIVSAIGALISGALLNLHGFGLRGWQWLFLLEGAPSMLLALVIYRWLPASPEKALFLSPSEKDLITAERAAAVAQTPALGATWRPIDVFTQPVFWALGLTNLGFIMCAYALGLWLPQIAKGYGFSILTVSWVVALPNVLGALAMLAWSRSRLAEVRGVGSLIVILVIACVFMIAASALIHVPVAAIILFTLASAALSAAIPAFWTLSSRVVHGGSAAAAIALINTIGSLSGVLGPPVVGILKDKSGGFQAGFLAVSAFLLASIVILAWSRRPINRMAA